MPLSESTQSETSTIHGIPTPTTTDADVEYKHQAFEHSRLAIPKPGHIFTIRSASCGRAITLLEGQVTLAHSDGRGSPHWLCVENKGWLGFRNIVSGKFLGYDNRRKICCLAERHREWENFCVRPAPDGGYVLLMTNWEALWHIGVEMIDGKERLAKLGEGTEGGMVWEFAEIRLESAD